MKGIDLKGCLPIAVLGVIFAVVLTTCVGNVGHTTRDNLDSLALVKSMDANIQLGKDIGQMTSLVDKMANLMTIQNVAIGIFVIVLLVVVLFVVKNMNGSHQPANNAPTIITLPGMGMGQPGYSELDGGSPRWVSFGPRGDNFLLNLPREQQRAALSDLKGKVALLESNLGLNALFLPKTSSQKSKSLVKW